MAATRPRAAISWSGGKDSCTALMRTVDRFEVIAAITMFDEARQRSRSHGLRPELLAAQVRRLGLEHIVTGCTWGTYDHAFSTALDELRSMDITHVIFGDIMFDEHRRWAERMCSAADLIAVEPLWGEPTSELLREFVATGSDAMIVTVRAALLDETWLGRTLSVEAGEELVQLGVDPCGERGEYHTFVTRTPLFSAPIAVRPACRVLRSDCWALDLELADASPEQAVTGARSV